jgi:phosphotransferase system HPr-like phosphotransfer protein
MKELVAAGCSFVEGQSMVETHNYKIKLNTVDFDTANANRLSKLVSDGLQYKEVNIASSGSSNERAIRRVYEYVNENGGKDKIFIIGLTELLRKEKYSSQSKSYIKWRNTIFFDKVSNIDVLDENLFKLLPSSFLFHDIVKRDNLLSKLKEYAKLDIMYFTDIENELRKLSQQLNMLYAYITSKGGKLLVFSAMMEQADKLKLDFDLFNMPSGNSWREFISSYDNYYHFSHHPAIADERILSENILKVLKQ